MLLIRPRCAQLISASWTAGRHAARRFETLSMQTPDKVSGPSFISPRMKTSGVIGNRLMFFHLLPSARPPVILLHPELN